MPSLSKLNHFHLTHAHRKPTPLHINRIQIKPGRLQTGFQASLDEMRFSYAMPFSEEVLSFFFPSLLHTNTQCAWSRGTERGSSLKWLTLGSRENNTGRQCTPLGWGNSSNSVINKLLWHIQSVDIWSFRKGGEQITVIRPAKSMFYSPMKKGHHGEVNCVLGEVEIN